MQARWFVLLVLVCSCGAAQSPAPLTEPPGAAPHVDTLDPPEQVLVRLPPAARRGHVSFDVPPTNVFWFKVIIQECLLEAKSVEITLRDSDGAFVYDMIPAGVIQFDNSTQSEWLALPHRFDEYTFERAAFRSERGQLLYALQGESPGEPISTFAIHAWEPNHVYMSIIDCEELQRELNLP